MNLQISSCLNYETTGDFKLVGDPESVHLVMQTDGNLVLYNEKNHAVWASHSERPHEGQYRASMQPDGNLVIYDSQNHPIWSTSTDGFGSAPFRLILNPEKLHFQIVDGLGEITYSSDLLK